MIVLNKVQTCPENEFQNHLGHGDFLGPRDGFTNIFGTWGHGRDMGMEHGGHQEDMK